MRIGELRESFQRRAFIVTISNLKPQFPNCRWSISTEIQGRSFQVGSQTRKRGFAPGARPLDSILLQVFPKKSFEQSYFWAAPLGVLSSSLLSSVISTRRLAARPFFVLLSSTSLLEPNPRTNIRNNGT